MYRSIEEMDMVAIRFENDKLVDARCHETVAFVDEDRTVVGTTDCTMVSNMHD